MHVLVEEKKIGHVLFKYLVIQRHKFIVDECPVVKGEIFESNERYVDPLLDLVQTEKPIALLEDLGCLKDLQWLSSGQFDQSIQYESW